MKRISKRFLSPATILMFAFLIIYTLSLLFMYGWGVITSLKTVDGFKADMFGLPKGVPWKWEWKNYAVAFNNFQSQDIIGSDGFPYRVGFVGMFVNSLIYSTIPPLITLTCTWAMSYICAQFPHRRESKILFSLNMVLMMIPVIGNMQSALQIYKRLNLYDTWAWAFIGAIGFVGTNFLVFYSFLRSIAPEMRDAARVDGAGNWSIMIRIIFPLSINMFLILFVTAFIVNWNDYMTMIIWLPSKPSLAYGMYRFQFLTGQDLTWPPVQVSACVILMIPVLTLFIIFKDAILGGVTIGTLK